MTIDDLLPALTTAAAAKEPNNASKTRIETNNKRNTIGGGVD
jgi:hypothetical protein